MATLSISFRAIVFVLSTTELVTGVVPLAQAEFSLQIEDLKKDFQNQIDYMFNIIKEKESSHANEITNLKRQVDILHAQCSSPKSLEQDSSSTVTKTNTTGIGSINDLTAQQNRRGNSEHRQENVSKSGDHLSTSTHQRNARVGQTYSNHVAFYSYLGNILTNLGNNQAIVFDHVVTNLANQYDANSGIFLCGVPGVYVFSVHLLVLPGKDVSTQLVKNGNMVSTIYAAGRGHTYDHGGNNAIIELAVGDKVWVRNYSATDDGASLDYYYSSFSGFLLYPY